MKKRWFGLILAGVLAASCVLVSCNKGDGNETAHNHDADEVGSENVTSSEASVVFTLHSAEGKAGEFVDVAVTVDTTETINSVALYELSYDADVLSFVGFVDWQEFEDTRCIIPGGFDDEKQVIALPMKDTDSIGETVCKIRFEVKTGAPAGVTEVNMSSLVKLNSTVIASEVVGAEVKILP